MLNVKNPTSEELPSKKQLFKSLILGLITALIIFLTIILPAEYAIDPTGIGKKIGLQEMGIIKKELAEEAEADSATSVAVFYGDAKLKKSKFYAAVAVDSDVKGYDATRITVGTKVSGFKLGLMYQTQEEVESGADKSGMMFSAQYKVGQFNLKGQYQTLEDDAGMTVGVDRKLGKNTKAYAFYTNFTPDMGEDASYLALGLEHKF
mgnify:CR=1 FL=1